MISKSEIIKSFGVLFQEYLYKSPTILTKRNLNKWIKKEQWDKTYQVTNLYTDSTDIEIKFKFRPVDTNEIMKSYIAIWKLKR